MNKALQLKVTGPIAKPANFTQKNGDVEFSTDGKTWSTDLPTDANTYQVRLTAQGEEAIKAKYANPYFGINWNIARNANFKISPIAVRSTLEGSDTKTYDGAVANVDPSKMTFNVKLGDQTVKLDTTGLTSADFILTDHQGNAIKAQKDVGTYYIKLTSAGLGILQKNNKNFTLTNAGLGKYTITQAQAKATLVGTGTRAYNGAGVTLADLNAEDANNTIALTLSYPKDGDTTHAETVKLTADDFVWNTPDHTAPVGANDQAYTLSLKTEVIK